MSAEHDLDWPCKAIASISAIESSTLYDARKWLLRSSPAAPCNSERFQKAACCEHLGIIVISNHWACHARQCRMQLSAAIKLSMHVHWQAAISAVPDGRLACLASNPKNSAASPGRLAPKCHSSGMWHIQRPPHTGCNPTGHWHSLLHQQDCCREQGTGLFNVTNTKMQQLIG